MRLPLPLHRGHLLGQRVGDRLGDQRLAAAGRAVEQDALRRPQLVLAEQVGVQERQLDGVADLLDLPRQATDVGVVDVGDLFEDQLLDLALRDPLVDVARPRLEQQRVTDAQRLAGQRVGEVDHALVVGVPDDQGALRDAVDRLEQLLEHDDVALALEPPRLDDVHRLVEHDLLAGAQVVALDVRRQRHPQLAAAGEDVDRAVVVLPEVDAVAGRRLAEPVDLLLERHQLLAGVPQRAGQLVVALAEKGGAALRLGDPFLQGADVPGAVGHLPAEEADLLLEVGDLAEQRSDIAFPSRAHLVRFIAGAGAHRAPPHTSGGARDQIYTRLPTDGRHLAGSDTEPSHTPQQRRATPAARCSHGLRRLASVPGPPGTGAGLHQPDLVGSDHRLDPVPGPDLGKQGRHVALDGRLADEQRLRDLGVREPCGDRPPDLCSREP